MKAVIIRNYGPPEVLEIKEVPDPQLGPSELLIKIKATAVTAADSRIRGSRFPKGFGFLARLAFGITKPRTRILGGTFSGTVVGIGDNVSKFKVDDEVCGMTGIKMGTYAQLVKTKETSGVVHKPSNISHYDAAGLVFGGTAALYFVRDKLGLKEGESLLINGASGAVGTNALQLAKYYGAKVTAVTSTDNEKLVIDLGADYFIDYTKEDFGKIKGKYDVVLDTVGNISPKLAKKLLLPNGRAGLMVAGLAEMLVPSPQIKTGTATEKKEDIEFLLSLVSEQKLKVVIDKVYDMDSIVNAHKHADRGKKIGNIIVKIE